MYKHILLATDLTKDSNIVAKKASELAKLYHAKLSLVHVVEYMPPFYGIGEVTIPIDVAAEDKLEEDARKKIIALAHKLELKKPLMWILAGDKHAEIVNVIQDNHIDLLVLGGHHHHSLHLVFGGSLPEIMVHHLLCDIVVVNLERNS